MAMTKAMRDFLAERDSSLRVLKISILLLCLDSRGADSQEQSLLDIELQERF